MARVNQNARRAGRINSQDIEEVLNIICRQKTATSPHALLIIRCCGNFVPEELPEVRTALVKKIWDTLSKLNVPMDISHYNALLTVYLENEHPFCPTEFLADLEAKGIEPNDVTYQRLISRYCQEGDIDGATKTLEYMKEKKLPVSEPVFNALIMGHSRAGNIDDAIGILPVMKQAKVEPTSDTYTTLACGHAKRGNVDEILNILDKCEENGTFLRDKDLMEIIYQLSTNGHNDAAQKIIPRLPKSARYNQDAVNVIFRLINKGQENIGYEILKTMPRSRRSDGELSDSGTFFVRQLVKAERPVETILSMCKSLKDEGLHERPTSTAVEMAIKLGKTELLTPLMKEVLKDGMPIRQNHFWPLICQQGKKGPTEMLNVIRLMKNEFDLTPSYETVRCYIVPNMSRNMSYDKIIMTLWSAGITVSKAAIGCMYDALMRSKIKEAATIASTYNCSYLPIVLRRPLTEALVNTNDYQSYISILRLQRSRNERTASEAAEKEDGESNLSQAEVLGEFVLDAVDRMSEKRGKVAKAILSGLVEQGLSISKSCAERIEQKLGSSLTAEISSLLERLTTGELEPISYESRQVRFNFSNLQSEQLEKMIKEKTAAGENVNRLYRPLLLSYMKSKNVQKVEETLEQLAASDFVITSGVYAHLVEMYCDCNDVDKALAIHRKIMANEPDFVLDETKAIKIVHELIATDRIDDALEFIKSNKREEKPDLDRSFDYNGLAEKGEDADVTKVLNTLLGPLVNTHLMKNDIPQAVAAFESICTKYKCTPYKNELSKHLIELDDTTNLQLVVDLSTEIHGEVNSLHDLAFSFLESGRIRQVRKILQTPGLTSRPNRISDACERYLHMGEVKHIENLVEATKGMNHIERVILFNNLLLAYCQEESPQKALDLWTRIQEEENVTLSDQFLSTLASYLKGKGVEVPFVDASKTTVKRNKAKVQTNASAVKKVTNSSGSKTLELMVQQNRLEDATAHLMKSLQANTYPSVRVLRFYFSKLAASGDYQTMDQLSPLISNDMKGAVKFDKCRGYTYLAAGKLEEFIHQLMKTCNDATTAEELDELRVVFPVGVTIAFLEQHPQHFEKFKKFAINLAERNFYTPINVVWMYQLENGKFDEAERLMKEHLINSPKIIFTHTSNVARKRKDEQLAKNLVSSLKELKLSEGNIGCSYSCLIDVYRLQGKYDEALKAVENAVADVCLENIDRVTLIKLKEGVEKTGKSFPYKIPDKKNVDDI